jgi:sulfate permease, SulP family
MVNDEKRPALFQGLWPIEKAKLARDALAGLTLGAMNIPQVLGYTRIAGTPVVTGLYTLLLPLVGFAAFGSSRYLVVSADSATAAILAGGLAGMAALGSAKYAALASVVALMTGLCLLLARLLRLGFLAEFLSQTVLVGFLTGVGFQVSIAVAGEVLGIEVHGHRTVQQVVEIVRGLGQTSGPTLALSAAVMAWIVGFRRLAPRFPAAFLAVAGAVAASAGLGLAARGVRVIGPVPGGLPQLGFPWMGFHDALALAGVAASCFLVILAQSAATARVYAMRHRQTLDENRDLVGLGAANLAAAFSGTFVVNGSPTQTAMVERSGGRSQAAHLATAAMVALVLLFLTKPLEYLPQCVLGAVVMLIAIDLIDLKGLRAIRRESPGEYWLAVMTAAIVVLVGVEQGIALAMLVSLLRIVQHSYHPHTGVLVDDHHEWRLVEAVPGATTEPGMVVYRFGAPLFYANASFFSEQVLGLVEDGDSRVHWLIVDAGAIPHVDYSAAQVIRRMNGELAHRGVKLIFARVQPELWADLERHRLTEAIGEEWVFRALHEAIAAVHAREGK